MKTFYDAAAAVNGAAPLARVAVIRRASEIAPEVIDWLWPGRTASRALTNLVGLPDQGKTLIYCDLAGRITTGSPLPPARRQPGQQPAGRVLILTNEDSLSTTLVPRLVKAGADLERVDFVQMVRDAEGRESLFTLTEDLAALQVALSTTGYTLVVFDGITGYLGPEVKSHNDADVRRVLTPLVALLDRAGVAGLSVMHPPKAITTVSYYAGGSVAFTGVPRVVLGVAPDPNDASESPRRFLAKLKGNLHGPVPTLAYRIVADGPAAPPWIEWEPESVTTADLADVFDPPREAPEDRGARRACEEWLRAFLADGPRPVVDVEKAAKDAHFKPSTLRRARERVADSVKIGAGIGGRWDWVLRR
jgi:hypothetical protein